MMAGFLAFAKKGLPYFIAVAVVIGALAFAHHKGVQAGAQGVQASWDAERAEQAAAAAKAASAAAVQQFANTQQALSAAARADDHQQQMRVVYRTITNTVTKYVDTHAGTRGCGLDAAGLRIWNAANAGLGGASSQAGGGQQSAGAVPTSPGGR
jgi:hypothetical protein